MNLLKQSTFYFINQDRLKTFVAIRKAAVLVYIHFAIICVVLITTIINQGFLHENNDPNVLAIPVIFLLLFVFKKTANFTLAANLIAITCFIFLVTTINVSGGLYSDDMIWLMLAPLMVIIFADWKIGFAWLIILHIFYISVLIMNKNTPINSHPYSDNYYAFNYIAISSFIFLLLKISETDKIRTILKLNDKYKLLRKQKKAIEQQTHALIQYEEQLLKSNQDLESFAYASSHDLKEPLRMIRMYTELLNRSLGDSLDNRQKDYIHFVIDGVSRMQILLDDLLQYSRLGKNDEDLSDINLNDRILVVRNNLTVLIKETNSNIISNELPTIQGSATEMTQLFQNIIANAIKFRKPNIDPIINISSVVNGDNYVFSIMDNGIGINKEYQEKVFTLFQRLHTRVAYEGSGIGLATCKKIVEGMNGTIWLASTEGIGTTVYFSIPIENTLNKPIICPKILNSLQKKLPYSSVLK